MSICISVYNWELHIVLFYADFPILCCDTYTTLCEGQEHGCPDHGELALRYERLPG